MNKRKYDGGKSPREKSKWDILEGIIGKKKAKIVRTGKMKQSRLSQKKI